MHSNELDLDPSTPSRSTNNFNGKTLGFSVFKLGKRRKDVGIRDPDRLGHRLATIPNAKEHRGNKNSPDHSICQAHTGISDQGCPVSFKNVRRPATQ
jgi:hypothetical protein